MSCEFIFELRRLKRSSADAVQNIDDFKPLQKYMHITRHVENDLRELLQKTEEVNHKQLVLVCGSAGDGKSHLLSYLINEDSNQLLKSYTVINDATESDGEDKYATETLANRIEAFSDNRLNDGGCEKIALAINLGTLNNFLDSESGEKFVELRNYVKESNIFSITESSSFNEDGFFCYIDFSNYPPYTLTESGAKSDYMTELFEKVFDNNDCNLFYKIYKEQGNTCPLRKHCPIRHNFEFLMKKDVRDLLIKRIIEVCIKEKQIITSRDILDFIFNAVVSPNFDGNKFWDLLSKPAEFLETYISYTTPMLVFENREASDLIDIMTKNATKDDDVEKRDCEVLNFYSTDDISSIVKERLYDSVYLNAIEDKLTTISNIDNGNSFKKDVYKFLRNYKKLTDAQELEADQQYLSFVKDLYYVYGGGGKKDLKKLYKSVKQSVYSWNGTYEGDLICIDDSSDDYSILEHLEIRSDIDNGRNVVEEVLRFRPAIMVRFSNKEGTEHVDFSIDYSLYGVIMKMKDGYCPTSQERNVHTDFSSGIKALSEFGTKKSKVFIVPKRKISDKEFQFEEGEFGYKFSSKVKEV